ncbi:polymorphic toxin type 44 domain-containing protein [Pseudodesulfovibrio karagichevae]|uniref:Polymorphic toxin type 44 domain-containing protein n=1 Tax=Pseudodesulfovibrio karagichevae TaxID=3239305 RepID=A0ABV4K242_9BACT
MTFGFKCWWIYENFASGARYDFKDGGNHPEYEDFGNYHYGLYIKAMGINVTFAQAATGAWQIKQKTSDWGFIGAWFDDPRDNRRIKEGQNYPLN